VLSICCFGAARRPSPWRSWTVLPPPFPTERNLCACRFVGLSATRFSVFICVGFHVARLRDPQKGSNTSQALRCCRTTTVIPDQPLIPVSGRTHGADLSTATSGISSAGPKPCSNSQRTLSGHRNDHQARMRSRSTSAPIAGEQIVEVIPMSEREDGEVEERVTLARFGPVDDAGDVVTGDEDVVDLQVAVGKHRRPRPERSLGELGWRVTSPGVSRSRVTTHFSCVGTNRLLTLILHNAESPWVRSNQGRFSVFVSTPRIRTRDLHLARCVVRRGRCLPR
jgi:hypothetical protein